MTDSGRGTRALTILLVCGGLAAPAAAQRAAGDDEPVGNSAVPTVNGGFGSLLGDGLGVFVKGLRIEGRVTTLYDSNIRRIGDGIPLRAGSEKADFRISPSVVVSNVLPFGRQQLYIEGEYGRDFYTRNTELNRDRYGVNGGLNARVGNFCTGAINASFRSRQSLLSEASIQQDNVVETKSVGASANCQRPVGIGFGVNASHDERDNKSVARQAFDSRTTSFGANVSYTLPVLGQISLGGNYSNVDYPRRTVLVGNPPMSTADGVDIYSGNISYRRSLGTRLTVNVGGSYYLARPDPRDVVVIVEVLPGIFGLVPQRRADFNGAGYLVGIAYRPSPRLTADIRAARDISQSSSVGALYVVRDSFGVDFGYNLGPSINTGIGATYDIRRYRNAFVSIEEPRARVRDNIGRVYARIGYSPRRLFDLDFEVAHQKRNSNPSIYDFSSTTAALTLRVKFGRG